MDKEKFIKGIVKELEINSTFNLDTRFKDLDEWDSISVMMLIGYVSDNFDIDLNYEDVEKIDTCQSLIEIIGQEKFN